MAVRNDGTGERRTLFVLSPCRSKTTRVTLLPAMCSLALVTLAPLTPVPVSNFPDYQHK